MNYLEQSITPGIEKEDCIIPFYRTTLQQCQALRHYLQSVSYPFSTIHGSNSSSLLSASPPPPPPTHRTTATATATAATMTLNPLPTTTRYPNQIIQKGLLPIYWKIEVADEKNGWFEAIALHYHFQQHNLHIIVRNKQHQECYNGYVSVDYRIIRLIECYDHYSKALFLKMIRDSIVSIEWEIDWLDSFLSLMNPQQTRRNEQAEVEETAVERSTYNEYSKRWIRSKAFYYIGATNLALVEDYRGERIYSQLASRCFTSYVLLYLDEHICLHRCCNDQDKISLREFQRLIVEEHIPCSNQARNQISLPVDRVIPRSFPNSPMQTPYEPFNSSYQGGNLVLEEEEDSWVRLPKGNDHIRRNTKEQQQQKQQKQKGGVSSFSFSCVICLEKEVANIAFIPCGHQILCFDCFNVLLPSQLPPSSDAHHAMHPIHRRRSNHPHHPDQPFLFDCPLCRKRVQSYLKLYKA